MREYIKFSLHMDSGEADITPASKKLLGEIEADCPLLAADLLRDIAGISAQLYEGAVASLHNEWAEIRGKQ